MQKYGADQTTIYQIQNAAQTQSSQYLSPEASIQKSRKQYFYVKVNLSILLVFMATISVQTQMQYYGPFVRTVQNFFNYHMLQHNSEDIYESNDVIYWRTQQYIMTKDIVAFFGRYVDTMDSFRTDSFFFPDHQMDQKDYGNQIVKILITTQSDDYRDQTSNKYLNFGFKDTQLPYKVIKSQKLSETGHTKQLRKQPPINRVPIKRLRQFFNLTVFNKNFYSNNIKKMELETALNIKFKDHQNCTIQVFTTCVFYSGMMMAVKVEVKVLDYEGETILQSFKSKEENQQNLGIRKLSEFHHMNFDFKYMAYVIFVVNSILFCVELMVVIRINQKIQQNLKEQREFSNRVEYMMHLQRLKTSPKPNNQSHIQNNESFFSSDDNKSSLYLMNKNLLTIKKLSYKERIEMIGFYNIIELVLSFLVLITVNEKGLVCLWCWTKMSIYLSETGNRMMIGFLFKEALPAYLKIIFNLLIWLSGFVFFSMVTYKSSRKFETVQLSYYQYFFNYFQYGIFQNFRPISRYGPMYTFLYFLQMAFLVMVGNNILQSILARQVLKNSNMKYLVEFIEGIQVECPVCGCPPEIKKKINLKLDKKTERENKFISEYFGAKKQAANKSKYEIQILSPEFSPMFHKSQYKKKEFKLRKISGKNDEILEDFIANSPPLSPINLSPMPMSPPFSPKTGALQEKKKVKIQIGGDLEEKKKMSKFEQYLREIKNKSELINKILHQIPKEHEKVASSISKQLHIQFLKKKIEEIKHLIIRLK